MVQETQKAALDVTQKFLVLYRHIRRYSRKTQCEGVRGRDLVTLRYLNEAGPSTIGQICEYLFISASSTSELVSRLEVAGYLERHRSTKDSRVVYVELTPRGKEIAEQPPTGGIPMLRERIKTLPPDRLQLLDEAFASLIEIMEIDSNDFK
jgi:DNA-binding MarR family transcriptional regulator